MPLGRKLAVEFVGTFFSSSQWGWQPIRFYGLAIGFTVAAGAFAVGGVSGGAFNPAVAFGASILGIFKWSHIWIYIIANLLGGAAAAYAFLYVQPAEKPSGNLEAARASD
jgi:aquaporin Z